MSVCRWFEVDDCRQADVTPAVLALLAAEPSLSLRAEVGGGGE